MMGDATVGPPYDGDAISISKAMKTKILSLMLLSLAPDLLCHLIPD